MIIWQEPPAHQELVAEAAFISRMGYNAGACRNLGYEAGRETGPIMVARFRAKALAAGLADDEALAVLERAGAAEDAVWRAALENPDDLPPEQVEARVRYGLTFMIERCIEASRANPELIVADGDEITTLAQFEAMMRAEGATPRRP